MEFTRLSLIAILGLSVLNTVATADEKTTVSGKAQIYYYTTDNGGDGDLTDEESTAGAGAVTLDVTHKVTDKLWANFSAVGYSHLGSSVGEKLMEGSRTGGYFNVANLSGKFGKTTFVAGRQLMETPMLGSFDWLLAPSSFEAYTIADESIDYLKLVASYVNKCRPNNGGDDFVKLKDDNYAIGAVYENGVNLNLWYYNVDVNNYTEIYLDVSKKVGNITVSAQGITTDYDDSGEDSTSYGLKVDASLNGFDMSVAYNNTDDREAGMVGIDSIYTSSWNNFASQDVGSSWKISFNKNISGLDASLSYADYETNGEEIDLIVGYKVADNVSLDTIFTNTKYNEDDDAENGLEFILTYTF